MNKKQDYINHDNITLLNSISNFKKDLSNKTIKNYIKNGMVCVNGKVITNSSYLLHNLIAINKPSGLLSISNDKEKEITAYRMVSDYVKKNSNNKYIFVVHRIDQDTSGVLMFSKNEKIRDKEILEIDTKFQQLIVNGKIMEDDELKSGLGEDGKEVILKIINNDE